MPGTCGIHDRIIKNIVAENDSIVLIGNLLLVGKTFIIVIGH
jgi:hypothetical protein